MTIEKFISEKYNVPDGIWSWDLSQM